MANKRGRKTAGQLSAVTATRPEPPEGLNETEERVWRETVSALPAEWFTPETLALLEGYCTAVDIYQRLSYKLDQELDRMTVDEIDKLTKVIERHGRFMFSSARAMRLTQQSTYRADKSKSKEPPQPAWANVANER